MLKVTILHYNAIPGTTGANEMNLGMHHASGPGSIVQYSVQLTVCYGCLLLRVPQVAVIAVGMGRQGNSIIAHFVLILSQLMLCTLNISNSPFYL